MATLRHQISSLPPMLCIYNQVHIYTVYCTIIQCPHTVFTMQENLLYVLHLENEKLKKNFKDNRYLCCTIFIFILTSESSSLALWVSRALKYPKKSVAFNNVFHVYLMRRLQINEKIASTLCSIVSAESREM